MSTGALDFAGLVCSFHDLSLRGNALRTTLFIEPTIIIRIVREVNIVNTYLPEYDLFSSLLAKFP